MEADIPNVTMRDPFSLFSQAMSEPVCAQQGYQYRKLRDRAEIRTKNTKHFVFLAFHCRPDLLVRLDVSNFNQQEPVSRRSTVHRTAGSGLQVPRWCG